MLIYLNLISVSLTSLKQTLITVSDLGRRKVFYVCINQREHWYKKMFIFMSFKHRDRDTKRDICVEFRVVHVSRLGTWVEVDCTRGCQRAVFTTV